MTKDELVRLAERYYPRPGNLDDWDPNEYHEWYQAAPENLARARLQEAALDLVPEFRAWLASLAGQVPGWRVLNATVFQVKTCFHVHFSSPRSGDVVADRVIDLCISILAPVYVLYECTVRREQGGYEVVDRSHEPSSEAAPVFGVLLRAVAERYPGYQRLGPADLAVPAPGLDLGTGTPLDEVTLGECLFLAGLE